MSEKTYFNQTKSIILNMDKREIPLSILNYLNQIKPEDRDLYKVVKDKKSILFIQENSHEPTQFFQILNSERLSGINFYSISMKPHSVDDPGIFNTQVEPKKIEVFFKRWMLMIQNYNSVKIFNDPFLKQYQEEFYHQFEIVDEDAEINSYNLEIQLRIDELLQEMSDQLEKHDPDKNTEIKLLQNDISELRESQSQMTKKKFVKSFSILLAKVRKYGIPLLKEILDAAKKEAIKQLLSGNLTLPNL